MHVSIDKYTQAIFTILCHRQLLAQQSAQPAQSVYKIGQFSALQNYVMVKTCDLLRSIVV